MKSKIFSVLLLSVFPLTVFGQELLAPDPEDTAFPKDLRVELTMVPTTDGKNGAILVPMARVSRDGNTYGIGCSLHGMISAKPKDLKKYRNKIIPRVLERNVSCEEYYGDENDTEEAITFRLSWSKWSAQERIRITGDGDYWGEGHSLQLKQAAEILFGKDEDYAEGAFKKKKAKKGARGPFGIILMLENSFYHPKDQLFGRRVTAKKDDLVIRGPIGHFSYSIDPKLTARDSGSRWEYWEDTSDRYRVCFPIEETWKFCRWTCVPPRDHSTSESNDLNFC